MRCRHPGRHQQRKANYRRSCTTLSLWLEHACPAYPHRFVASPDCRDRIRHPHREPRWVFRSAARIHRPPPRDPQGRYTSECRMYRRSTRYHRAIPERVPPFRREQCGQRVWIRYRSFRGPRVPARLGSHLWRFHSELLLKSWRLTQSVAADAIDIPSPDKFDQGL